MIRCYKYLFIIIFRAISQLICLLIATFLSFGHVNWSLPYDFGNLTNLSNSTTNSTDINSQQQPHHNEYAQRLYRVCNDGHGMYGIITVHDKLREDRRWNWQCRKLVQQNSSQSCYWSRDVNDYNRDISFTCCDNEYLCGVDSYHNNSHDDRKWSFYCCGASGITTHNCYMTGYQNRLDGDLDFQAPLGSVIMGVFSRYVYNE